MNRIVMTFLAAAAAASLSCACSSLFGEKQPPGPDLSKMTPKERADYEAFANARQRFYEKKYKAQANGEAPQTAGRTAEPDNKKKQRYSLEKRERLSDMNRPVLLQDSEKSIFPWKENSGRRSEKLHDRQENQRSTTFGR